MTDPDEPIPYSLTPKAYALPRQMHIATPEEMAALLGRGGPSLDQRDEGDGTFSQTRLD
jgi:hypothetical protein